MSLLNVSDLEGIFQPASVNPSSRLVCYNSSRIYVWQNGILRVQSEVGNTYKSYDLEVPFTPEAMILDISGDLIAFHSKSEFYVVEVRQNTRLKRHHKPEAGIKRLLWHPLATYGLSVVILHEDSSIQIYDLNELDVPKPTIFNLKTKSFGLSDHVESVCDITFDTTGLVLYLLSSYNFCDVYAIYPFLPDNFTLDGFENNKDDNDNSSLADYMYHKSLSQFNNVQKELNQSTMTADVQQSDMLPLSHDLLKQIQFFKSFAKKNESLPFSYKVLTKATPQGPFRIKGFSNSLYEKDVIGITNIPISKYLGLLALQFEDGSNIILFPDSEPIMSWTPRNINPFNSFTVITSFQAQGSCTLLNGTKPKLAYVGHTAAIFVELPWLSPLSECIKLNDFSSIEGVDFDVNITTISGSFSGVIPTITADVLYDNQHIKVIESEDKKESTLRTPKNLDVKYTYKPALPISSQEIEMLVMKYKSQAKHFVGGVPDELASVPFKNDNNEDQLEIVSKLYKNTMGRVKMGQMIAYRMFNKLQEQQNEIHRQLRKTNRLNELKVKLEGNLSELEERHAASKEKSKQLDERLDKLKETFTKIENSQKLKTASISDAEVAWFKTIRTQVLKFNEYVHMTNNLREELEFLDKKLKAIHTDKTDLFSDAEFNELQQMLLNDKKVINACVSELTASVQTLEM